MSSVVMAEARMLRLQPLEVPGRVALGPEEVCAQVVVDADGLGIEAVEVRDRLRSDQPLLPVINTFMGTSPGSGDGVPMSAEAQHQIHVFARGQPI